MSSSSDSDGPGLITRERRTLSYLQDYAASPKSSPHHYVLPSEFDSPLDPADVELSQTFSPPVPSPVLSALFSDPDFDASVSPSLPSSAPSARRRTPETAPRLSPPPIGKRPRSPVKPRILCPLCNKTVSDWASSASHWSGKHTKAEVASMPDSFFTWM